jgi:hypothetical protein
MGRETNRPITYFDAQYMVDNEGFDALQTIPQSAQCMTKTQIESHINADTSNFSSYAANQLVPYHLLTPHVDSCTDYFNGSQGYYVYNIDYGTSTGWAGIDYDAMNVPDKFTIEWNGNTYTTGYVGHSDYDQQLIDAGVDPSEINTANPSNGDGILKFEKTSATPTTAKIIVEGKLGGTGWNIQGKCVGTVTPPVDTEAPTFPANALSVTGQNATSISLAWQAASDNVGVTQYKIWRKKTSEQGYVLHTTLSNTVTNYTVSGLDTNTSYDLFVEALDDMNNEGATNTVTHSTSAPATLTISPVNEFVDQNTGQFTLTITTTEAWTLTDNQFWLSASATSGTGNASVTIYYDNNTGAYRSGEVTVSITGTSRTCYIDQAAAGGGF